MPSSLNLKNFIQNPGTNPTKIPSKNALVKIWIITKVLVITIFEVLHFLVKHALNPKDKGLILRREQIWARKLLKVSNIRVDFEGEPPLAEPCLFVGNHVSYADIVVLMSLVPVVFVAKEQVKDWPIFGWAAEISGTVFVDRDSATSRKNTLNAISNGIAQDQKQIAIFPEGTSSMYGKDWKRGSLSAAKEGDFPVQPFALLYTPGRLNAFIDDDAMVPHLWKMLDYPNPSVKIVFGKPEKIKDSTEDTQKMQDWVQGLVHAHLKNIGEGQNS